MKRIILAVVALTAATALWATTNPTTAIIERIQSGVQVCVTGQDCSAEAMAAASVAQVTRSGEDVYGAACAACHNSGAAGAPRLSAGSDWQSRLDARGMEGLVSNAINGYNAMPAKGGCGDCSDEEIANSVQYIIDEAI